MKAVILAGGEGSRLRPLTLGRPKPMTPLFGKPVLGHILDLLRRHGVTEIAVTLHYLPAAITDFFGDGSEYGVKLHYVVEREAVGTAGSVKLCDDFLGEGDFLVVSGDAVTDLDLTELCRRHREAGAAASLALCRREEPLEYGLVRTDGAGRILGFVEKPGWGQVTTELVNTGLYVLSRRAMDLVPPGADYDFGKELFPKLLERGEALYGFEVPGYWQDMGDCGAYLEALRDGLRGKVELDLAAGAGPIPEGVEIRPPCWIGERVTLERGCTVGPNAVLGPGSSVAAGALVEDSVLLGSAVGTGAEVTGAILCGGASVHRQATVGAGAVLGEKVTVGAEATVAPGVKLWPGRTVPQGGRATASQMTAGQPEPLRFSPAGTLRGVLGEELTPEVLLALGAVLGEAGRVVVGQAGGTGAELLARALVCGVNAAGGTAVLGDAPSPAAGSWLGGHVGAPFSLFVLQTGESVQVHLFGPDGLPPLRPQLRKVEGALLRGETSRVPAHRLGGTDALSGTAASYLREAVLRSRLDAALPRPPAVLVDPGAENDLLAAALAALGCRVDRDRTRAGCPAFATDRSGLRLWVRDEGGEPLSEEVLLVLLTRIQLEQGDGRAVLPPWAPAAADQLAKSLGGRLLRLGRDGAEARELWRDLPWLRDALFAACRLCARMAHTGESLRALVQALPRFATVRGEVPLKSGRGRVMGAALETDPAARSEGEGVRTKVGEGWVYLVPLGSRRALRVIAEASTMEAARELCGFYEDKLRRLDAAPDGERLPLD